MHSDLQVSFGCPVQVWKEVPCFNGCLSFWLIWSHAAGELQAVASVWLVFLLSFAIWCSIWACHRGKVCHWMLQCHHLCTGCDILFSWNTGTSTLFAWAHAMMPWHWILWVFPPKLNLNDIWQIDKGQVASSNLAQLNASTDTASPANKFALFWHEKVALSPWGDSQVWLCMTG